MLALKSVEPSLVTNDDTIQFLREQQFFYVAEVKNDIISASVN